MGFFDRVFGAKIKIPPRHRSAAYMNLAFGLTPTEDGVGAATWDTSPTNLLSLTDENFQTHITQDGVDAAAEQVYIEIDLGREFEVYEIKTSNIAGTGFNHAIAGAGQDVMIITGITGETPATGTTRDTQAVPGTGVWTDTTLHYVGQGIPVRYVWISTIGDGANNFNVDLSQIEVFGC